MIDHSYLALSQVQGGCKSVACAIQPPDSQKRCPNRWKLLSLDLLCSSLESTGPTGCFARSLVDSNFFSHDLRDCVARILLDLLVVFPLLHEGWDERGWLNTLPCRSLLPLSLVAYNRLQSLEVLFECLPSHSPQYLILVAQQLTGQPSPLRTLSTKYTGTLQASAPVPAISP